jgi:hypothetical protein
VHVGEDGADEPDGAGVVREDGHYTGSPLDLLVDSLAGLVEHTIDQCGRGKPVKARASVLASSISGPIVGNRAASWSRDLVLGRGPLFPASGWAKIVRNSAAIMPVSVGVGVRHQDVSGITVNRLRLLVLRSSEEEQS